MTLKRTTLAPIFAIAACVIAGCSTVSTEPDQVGLHYNGGSFSSKNYSGFVPAAKHETHGPGDKYYLYPTGQRSFDATGGPGAEHAPYTSSSKDSVELATPLSVTFELNTDPATLRKFHENIGLKYAAYYDENTKDPTGISAGWGRMLEFYMGQSIDTTVDRVLAGYNWRDAYGDANVRNAIQSAVQNELPGIVKAKMGDAYFTNWAVQVQRPVPTNGDLLKSIADTQNQVAQAQANKAKADADLATARSQIALQQAEAQKRKADISAYGSADQYNKAQAIEKGINPYQPTYVVPGTAPGNR